MAETGAMERAFRDQCEGGAVFGADADADLLDGLRGEDGKLPGNVFQLVRQGQAQKRGAGRPAGAKNKRNAKLAQLICQEHGDPVMFMASLYAMPLDQMVELLRLADDSAAMEERLYKLAEKIEGDVVKLIQTKGLTVKQLDQVDRLVDRLGDIAKVLRVKPGDLAVKALALQKQAAQEVATYVHGKQPVSVQVEGRLDAVILAPSLAGHSFADPRIVEDRIRKRGLSTIDLDSVQLLPSPDGDDEDEGSEE